MNKEDFFSELAECLQGEVSEREYRDAVSYYKDYFREQEELGRSDEEVLSELGSARYIAHSIIDAHGPGEYEAPYGESGDEIVNDPVPDPVNRALGRVGRTIAIVAVLLVIGAILGYLLPVIFAVIAVIFIVNMFRRM